MSIVNISAYRFCALQNLQNLKASFFAACQALGLKGTILLSEEGINFSLAGGPAAIQSFKDFLKTLLPFQDLSFMQTFADKPPFKRLKIKIKKEIISFREENISPLFERVPVITPYELKQCLDEKRLITLLDTRNDYEIQYGQFKNAFNLKLKDFTDFKIKSSQIKKDQTIVMYCTGGIRCERAGLYLLQQGYSKVYQLEGGILNYFDKMGGAHYQGDCFIFDDRIALNPALKPAFK